MIDTELNKSRYFSVWLENIMLKFPLNISNIVSSKLESD